MATALSKKLLKYVKRKGFGDSIADSKFANVTDYLPMKAHSMNLLASAGVDNGVPVGKSLMLAGPKSSGKTILALSVMKAAQDKGYTIIYWDAEFAAFEESFESMGINTDEVIHVPMASLNDIKTAYVNLVKEIEEDEKVLHVFDSMGAWITDKTIKDAESGNDARDMTISSSKKTFMTIINESCGKKNMGAVIINHSYANIGGYGAATTVSGGGALYLPSVIIEMKSKAKWKVKDEVIGSIFNAECVKGRMSKEYGKAKYAISQKKGIAPYYGLIDYAVAGGYLTETTFNRNKAYQITHHLEVDPDAKKFVQHDWETIYYSDEIFPVLYEETNFKEYLAAEFAYGDDVVVASLAKQKKKTKPKTSTKLKNVLNVSSSENSKVENKTSIETNEKTTETEEFKVS